MTTLSEPVRILIVGINPETNAKIVGTVNEDKSILADGFVASNNPECDAELINVIKQSTYGAVILGGGLRAQQDWYERIQNIIKSNSDLPAVGVKGPTVNYVKEALTTIGVLKG
ncbi:unnamed protein product [Adineta ricciae]|uniref:Uncharacterized protein n=1 Tax=Adineta ricciae TaxID=249248 RepID=A0A815BRC6_ADIRI|nr:unnamed protein product [Adineta ricciae]CAF1369560.1 unnamed protein product [Adineta ricciae]